MVRMMNSKQTSVMIRRTNSLALPMPEKTPGHLGEDTLVALQQRVLQYNYVLSPEVLEVVSAFSRTQVAELAQVLEESLSSMPGAYRYGMNSFYPNFPEQVAAASETELMMNALLHYFGRSIGLRIIPVYPVAERSKLSEKLADATVLNLSKSAVLDVVTDIYTSSLSISINDAVDASILADTPEMIQAIADRLRSGELNRENVAHFLALAEVSLPRKAFVSIFANLTKTATDVLRFVLLRSGGDASLAKTNTRIASIPRPIRRAIMDALNKMDLVNVQSDFARYEGAWKRVARALHPGEYKNTHASAVECFYCLANHDLPKSFAGFVDLSFENGDLRDLVVLLSTRPTEFARRLNRVLTFAETAEKQRSVVKAFRKVAEQVPTTVLWQMLPLFENRNYGENRVIYPKGQVTRSKIIPMPEKAYSDEIADAVSDIIVEAMIKSYSKGDKLGKVWVDPELSGYTVPVGLRSASKASNAIGRGTRIPISGKKVERFFVWWKDTHGQTIDVDLSVLLLDENFNPLGYVSYQNLRFGGGPQPVPTNAKTGETYDVYIPPRPPSVLHSGDFTSAPRGAAEYIDVDVSGAQKDGVRYAVMVGQVYSGDTFETFECYAGVMGRDQPQSGEVFDVKTVSKSFEISAAERTVVPMVIDLERGEFVWGDVAGTTYGIYNNVSGAQNPLANLAQGIVQKPYGDLYRLFTFHAAARGQIVENRDEADVVFAVENSAPNVTLDKIVADFV